jgi:hypothetical protein
MNYLKDRALLRGSLFLLQLAALILLMGRTFWTGFPLDDAWIHQQVARTLANLGTLGIYADRPGAGATSYLWALVLSLDHLPIWPTHSPVLFTHALNAILYLASGQLFLSILLGDGLRTRLAWTIALLFSTAGNVVWFAGSGMEAMSFIFLTLLGIYYWQRADPLRGSLGAGIVAGMLFLLRPETVLFVPLLLLFSRRPNLGRTMRLALPLCLILVTCVLMNRSWTGQAVPTTLSGRRWLYFGHFPGASYMDFMKGLLWGWTDALGKSTLGIHWGGGFWLTLGLALQGMRTIQPRCQRGLLLLVCWTLVHLATYVVLFPSMGHGGRYQPLLPGIFMALAGLGLVSVYEHFRNRHALLPQPNPQVFPALLLVGLSVVSLTRWRRWQDCAVEHINRSEIQMGQLLSTLPAEARVASFDIGAITYFSARRIVDLGGLVDPAFIPFLWSGHTADYLRREGIDHVVLPVTLSDDYPGMLNFRYRLGLLDDPTLRLVPVAVRESTVQIWSAGFSAVWNASPRQCLYRVEWQGGGT